MKYLQFITLTLLFTLLGCSPPKMNKKLAQVEGQVIKVGDLTQAFYREGDKYGDDIGKNPRRFLDVKKQLLEDLIQKRILEKEAQKQGVEISSQELEQELVKYKSRYSERDFQKILESKNINYAGWREVKRVNLLIDKLVREKLFSHVEISEDEMKKYYEAHVDEFTRPEMVRVRQILTDTKEKVEALYERLKEGENFARLAHDYSLSPDRSQGGDVGFIAKGRFPKEFDICFDLKVGELSPIVSSLYGFHIFKVTEKKPEEKMNFNQVKEQIKTWLTEKTREEAFQKYYQELRKKYPVEVSEWTLKRIKI